jgi:hypothetical protein
LPKAYKTAYLALFLFSACAGFSTRSGGGVFQAPEAASPSSVSQSPGGALNENPVLAPGFWDTAPSAEFLFFIGASALRSNREESVRLALEDAARKVAMYHFLQGRYESRVETGGGFLEYRADTASSLDYDKDYLKYTEDLDYDLEQDILQWENSLFVRARYLRAGGEAPPPAGIPSGVSAAGLPPWVNTPPGEMPGYVYGVGLAGRQAYHRDTVNASCEAAVFSIIRNLSSRARSNTADAQKSGSFGYSGSAGVSVSSALSLRNFYVLDTWIDPASKAVWTLALARDSFPEKDGAEGEAEAIENSEEFGYKDEKDLEEEN